MFMTTYQGREIDVLNPNINKIDIQDISHALSFIARGNGHIKYFYSVAQHCINCCLEAKNQGYSNKIQLLCLLHDASEAYLSDIVRPVKGLLPQYLEIENKLQNTIYSKYIKEPITKDELEKMKIIDDSLLNMEFQLLMKVNVKKIEPINYDLQFKQTEFDIIKSKFIQLFNELIENQ